jgi:hypothetical protein
MNRLLLTGQLLATESIELFIEDQAFSLSMIRFLPHPLAPLSRQQAVPATWATHKKTEKEKQLADGSGGRGWGRSQIIPRRESLVLYKNHSILSTVLLNKECE